MSVTPVTVFQSDVETVTEFLQRFKVQNSSALEKASGTKKAELLCRSLPVNIITDVQRRIKPTLLVNAKYSEIEDSLLAQFSVKKSIIGASVKFINRKQQPGESIETYAKILNDLASCCTYSDCCRDRLLRDAFVSGLSSNKLIGSLLQDCENKSFNDSVERAKTLEQLAHDAADMKPAEKSSSPSTFKIDRHENKSKTVSKKTPDNYTCIRCGTRGKHVASKCFALKLTCNQCGKTGHLGKVCQTKFSRVNTVSGESDAPPSESVTSDQRHQSAPSQLGSVRSCCSGISRCCKNVTNNDSNDADNFLW